MHIYLINIETLIFETAVLVNLDNYSIPRSPTFMVLLTRSPYTENMVKSQNIVYLKFSIFFLGLGKSHHFSGSQQPMNPQKSHANGVTN